MLRCISIRCLNSSASWSRDESLSWSTDTQSDGKDVREWTSYTSVPYVLILCLCVCVCEMSAQHKGTDVHSAVCRRGHIFCHGVCVYELLWTNKEPSIVIYRADIYTFIYSVPLCCLFSIKCLDFLYIVAFFCQFESWFCKIIAAFLQTGKQIFLPNVSLNLNCVLHSALNHVHIGITVLCYKTTSQTTSLAQGNILSCVLLNFIYG